MTTEDFTLTLTSNKKPEDVFKAITDVRGWWSGLYNEEFEGGTETLHDEFTFNADKGVHYSKHRLIEVIPNKKIVWLVVDSSLSFVEKKDEWIGTKIIFEISEKDGKTELTFTHKGLTPEIECYGSCSMTWTQYLQEKLSPRIN